NKRYRDHVHRIIRDSSSTMLAQASKQQTSSSTSMNKPRPIMSAHQLVHTSGPMNSRILHPKAILSAQQDDEDNPMDMVSSNSTNQQEQQPFSSRGSNVNMDPQSGTSQHMNNNMKISVEVEVLTTLQLVSCQHINSSTSSIFNNKRTRHMFLPRCHRLQLSS
ncbi:unnamed protein product, partial [Amoebophrya sp. A25]